MKRWLPLWLLPQLALAASLRLDWSFPRAYTPPPAAFLITYTAPDGQTLDQMSTPPSAVGACAGTPGPDAYCTAWPACPAPGVVVFWVQAAWSATDVSERSDPLVVCLFTAQAPCVCHDPATYTPPPLPPGMPVAVPPLPPGEIAPITHATAPPVPAFAPVFPPAQA